MRLRLKSAPLVLLLAGCLGESPGTTAQTSAASLVAHEANAWTLVVEGSDSVPAVLTIIDQTGTLRDARAGAPDELLRSVSDVSVGNVAGRELAVAWVSVPCDREPVLTLASRGDSLAIGIDRGSEAEGDCEAMGIAYGITLEFEDAVNAAEVAVTIQ